MYVHGFLRNESIRGVQCVCFNAVDESIIQIPAKNRSGRCREDGRGIEEVKVRMTRKREMKGGRCREEGMEKGRGEIDRGRRK